MTYKCKICGGQTSVDTANGIAICEYCGTKQALPLFTDNSERLLYERGNNYLSHSEYDKAENVFNQLLTIKPNAAVLYWDLVLCKYGVTYVKDPKTDKYIPTCNRTHYAPIFSDKNYQKAIELSSGEKRTLFEEDAKTIDNIQKGIIAVSKKEKPFDIFISYKETDASGNRTKDSIEAQKLYEKLTEAGYKVFFSRITLEDKIGTEYEPYIYAALYSSKVMLTICSSQENIEAVWVKNEWSRFLGFRQNDNAKALLPLYFDMDKAALPDEFALLSAYDMHTDGFEDELLRGIKKLIPLPIMKAKRRKQMLKTAAMIAASLVVVAGIAAAIIIPKKMEENRLREEARIRASEEAVRASEEAAKDAALEMEYQTALTLFDNGDYTAAKAAFIALGDYKDAVHMTERCSVQPEYDAAIELYYDGEYAQAAWAFAELGDYEDSAAQKEKAELSWRKSLAAVTFSADRGRNYYITPNGTVADTVAGYDIIEVGEHGEVISITNGFYADGDILALHEDGTVLRVEDVLGQGAVAQNVIQITPTHWELGDIILKSDGTVSVENSMWNHDYEIFSYDDAADWKNIVMLSSAVDGYGESDRSAALAGVDADGNVYLCLSFEEGLFSSYPVSTFLDDCDLFRNVKTIDISLTTDYENKMNYVDAVALTNDGKLISYINGNVSVEDATDVIDVCIGYYLSSDGSVRKLGVNRVIATDVIKISNGVIITRSGTIDGETGLKTAVHDEWLLRME